MKIGDEVFVHGYVDEIRKDCIIIRNDGGYFGTEPCEVEVKTDNPQYVNGYLDALNEIMKYSYGMLDAEKFGLQHKVQSMIWDFMGDKVADTPQTESSAKVTEKFGKSSDAPQTDCDTCKHRAEPNVTCDRCDKASHSNYDPQTDCSWK